MMSRMRAALLSPRRHILALPSPAGCGWQIWDNRLGWQPTIYATLCEASHAACAIARRLWQGEQGVWA